MEKIIFHIYTVNDYRQKLFFLPAFAYNCVAPPCFSASQNKAFAKKFINNWGRKKQSFCL